jgi:hypothetical protein
MRQGREKTMKVHMLVAALALAVTGAISGAPGALADSPASDAAHVCLQGPQRDYYEVVGATDSTPPLDYHGLLHGSDDTGPFILAESHGDCVNFAADNSKGSKGGKPAESISINYTKVEYVNTTQ